jgi:hypothetical protein
VSDTTAPPAPTAAAPEPPVEAAAAPPMPAPAPAVEKDVEAEPRTRRRHGGVPIEPLVIGVGNGTAVAATAAYQAGGPIGLAAAAGTAVALAAGGALQRRRTVRRRTTAAAGRIRSGASGLGRGRARGGASLGSSGRGVGSGRGGASRRGAGSGASGAGSSGRGGAGRTRRSALGSLGGRGVGRLKTPRLKSPKNGAKRKRPGSTHKSPSKNKRTPRTGSRLGMLRPAASAARRGMAGAGRALRSTGRAIASAGRGIGRAGRRIASPVRALWRHSETARRAAARRIGRAAGALWDGALAGLVGIATGLWQRSWRRGIWGVRAMWRRRRMNRAAKRAARGPAMTGADVANTPPPVATFVRRPAAAGGSPSTLGGTMNGGGHHFLAPAMEMERIASTYTPDSMMQVGTDFAKLPDALEHVANAMKISTARADQEQPLDPRIIELMQGLYTLQMKAVELSRELVPAFKNLHDVDIARIEAPRKGVQAESMWDVSRNAGSTF